MARACAFAPRARASTARAGAFATRQSAFTTRVRASAARAGAFTLFLVLAAAASPAADLDEVVAKLQQAQNGLKTYSAKFELKSQISKDSKSEAKGTFEWQRAGDTVRFRQDVQRKTTHEMDGEKMVVDESQTTMSDGQHHYQIRHETKNVLKQKFDPEAAETLNVAAVLNRMSNDYPELEVLPDEKVAGLDCAVISGSREPDPSDGGDEFMIAVVKETIWFARDTGFPVRMRAYDKGGQVVHSKEFSDIQKDPKIDPERFVFKAAEGANVMDHSGG